MGIGAGRRIVVGVMGLGLGVLGCSPNSSSAGTGSGPMPVDDGGTTAFATGQLDGTGVADGAGTMAGDGGDDVTTTPADDGGTGPGPTGGGTDDGANTTGGDDPGESSSGEPPPPMQELLSNQDFAGCDLPMWCFTNQVSQPVGQQQWMQECFHATLTPPFDLHEVELDLWNLGGDLDTLRVEVYANDGAAGPGALLGERPFSSGLLGPGLNTITLDPPLTLDQQDVCIGIASPNPAGALGIAVNESSVLGDASFFRMQAGGDCDIPSWTDVIDLGPTPTGNWCIRATIESP